MRWLKPGVDFAKYDKVMLDSVVFFYAEDSGATRSEMMAIDSMTGEVIGVVQDERTAGFRKGSASGA